MGKKKLKDFYIKDKRGIMTCVIPNMPNRKAAIIEAFKAGFLYDNQVFYCFESVDEEN